MAREERVRHQVVTTMTVKCQNNKVRFAEFSVDQVQVARKVDNAVNQINHYPADSVVIPWIAIYQVDNVIQPSRNWLPCVRSMKKQPEGRGFESYTCTSLNFVFHWWNDRAEICVVVGFFCFLCPPIFIPGLDVCYLRCIEINIRITKVCADN